METTTFALTRGSEATAEQDVAWSGKTGRQIGRPRVLLVADLANPEWASVPREGWSHSRALAELTDVHLVTQVRNRDAIERAQLPTDQFTLIDSGLVEQPVEKISRFIRGGTSMGWTTATALGVLPYYYFEHLVWRQFEGRIRTGEFDIVHRLTPISPTTPSILASRCARASVPFVLGPLNGGLPWPESFDAVRRREREWLSYVRDAHKLMPGYRSTRRDAAAIIAGSCATWEQIPNGFKDKAVYIPENAIDPQRFNRHIDAPVGLPLRVAFVGRLVRYKGADMLIEAAAPLVRQGRVTLDVIGDGPELPALQALISREGLGTGVTLAGHVEHHDLQDRLIQSQIFGFPSIREFGGAVVVEAMALGLVPIVVAYGGPGEHVSPGTGFTVPLGSRAEIIAAFRSVLERLTDNPSVISTMGPRARQRALCQFTWQAKARQVLEVYRWVRGERPNKPDFGMPLPDSVEQEVIA